MPKAANTLLIPAFAPGLIEAVLSIDAPYISIYKLIPAFAPGLIEARLHRLQGRHVAEELIPAFAPGLIEAQCRPRCLCPPCFR